MTAQRGLEKMMVDADCREWLSEFFEDCGLHSAIGGTGEVLAQRAGMHAVVAELYDRIRNQCPRQLILLLQEDHERRAQKKISPPKPEKGSET